MTVWRIITLGALLPADGSVRRIEAPDPLTALDHVIGHPMKVLSVWSHQFEGTPAMTLVTTEGWATIMRRE